MTRKTPADLDREIEFPLRRFWARYGMAVDFTLGALVLAAVAFCIGYMAGVSGR